MTDTEKLLYLKLTLAQAVNWFRKNMADDGKGEDYVYDEAIEQFSDLRRGEAFEILKTLAED